jgi:hypothetical protein
LFWPDCLSRPGNDLCWWWCKHFGARVKIETRIRCPLRFHQSELLAILVKFTTSLLILQHEQFFERTLGNWHTAPRECYHSRLSLKNDSNRKDGRQEVVGNQQGAGKRILLSKCSKLRAKARRGRPGRRESLQDRSPFLNLWSHVSIWESP